MCDFFDVLDSKVLSNPDIRKIATKCAQKKKIRGKTGVLLGTSVLLKETMFQKNLWDYWECWDLKQKLEQSDVVFCRVVACSSKNYVPPNGVQFNIQSFTICRISPKKSSHCFQLQFPGCFSRLKFKGPRNDKCLAESHFSSLQKPAQKAHPQNTL